MEDKENSKLEMTLEITHIKDWLIGNPKENIDIVCHGKLEKNGIWCPITIQIPYRKLAKSIGLPLEFNNSFDTYALSKDIIGKKYILKVSEE